MIDIAYIYFAYLSIHFGTRNTNSRSLSAVSRGIHFFGFVQCKRIDFLLFRSLVSCIWTNVCFWFMTSANDGVWQRFRWLTVAGHMPVTCCRRKRSVVRGEQFCFIWKQSIAVYSLHVDMNSKSTCISRSEIPCCCWQKHWIVLGNYFFAGPVMAADIIYCCWCWRSDHYWPTCLLSIGVMWASPTYQRVACLAWM